MTIRVNIAILGHLKHKVDLRKIERWKSNVFSVQVYESIQSLPNAKGENWSYTDIQLAQILNHNPEFDITVGLINAPLHLNYYIRRLGDNKCVLSLHETGDILRLANLSIENFILRNIYEFCCFYHELGQKVPDSVYTLAHDETRGCLFDMNANKFDIVYSTERPRICEACRARIMAKQIPRDFLKYTDRELQRIKKPLYMRIIDFIKSHPLWALIIAMLSTIGLNLVASYIFMFLTRS
jgi:hypothetical protein